MEPHTLRSLQKKRTTNFREDETKLLIQLWGSPQIQNKLYLTHRKEPVMRILAANMQHRGFYRTPDEIKTRIRNLKCLYHRIKRQLNTGTGIGTVDPDWPHYKAMDAILTKQAQKKDIYKENVFEGPRCEDIKQEIIDEIDINDDMESYTTNSLRGSEYEDEQTNNLPPLTPAPRGNNISIRGSKIEAIQPKTTPSTNNNFTIQQVQQQQNQNVRGTIPSIPFPLLILNSLQTQANQDKKEVIKSSTNLDSEQKTNDDINSVLKELLEVQKENLDIEKQRLELEKQRLEFERFVGSQLLAFGPVIGTVFQKMVSSASEDNETSTTETKNCRKRAFSTITTTTQNDSAKDSKILRTLLDESVKKFDKNHPEANEREGGEASGVEKVDKLESKDKK